VISQTYRRTNYDAKSDEASRRKSKFTALSDHPDLQGVPTTRSVFPRANAILGNRTIYSLTERTVPLGDELDHR
jgi:hypothetical protein